MIRIESIELFTCRLRTRFPFRYGIAEMTELPHLFLRLNARFGNKPFTGLAADHLPPRWFKKDPRQPLDAETRELFAVIRRAARAAIGSKARTPFDWWLDAYSDQMAWARAAGLPPLLAHFGVTLVERALIEASAKAAGVPFHRHLLSGGLGFAPKAVHPELAGFEWRHAFPQTPKTRIHVRHTVGLDDPIEASDLKAEDSVEDGLPQSLADAIDTYGLRHFKIKLSGDASRDEERLAKLAFCFERHCPHGYAYSLDANEYYSSMAAFRDAWERLSARSRLDLGHRRLLFVEQPVSRDHAFDAPLADSSPGKWKERPPIIIDESDAEIDSLPRALELGYSGTSHKNCKGVFKGLANHCLLAKRRTEAGSTAYLLTGEDLSNIGPVALLQDLTVQASLGVSTVERNGHHYFKGLSAFPRQVNEHMLRDHPDLFHQHENGFATVWIKEGTMEIESLTRAPFGPASAIDPGFAKQIPIGSD